MRQNRTMQATTVKAVAVDHDMMYSLRREGAERCGLGVRCCFARRHILDQSIILIWDKLQIHLVVVAVRPDGERWGLIPVRAPLARSERHIWKMELG